jgi:uncharacterized phage-associated protein
MSIKFATYNSNDVADYILTLSCPEEGDLMSNLKIQKLCYYAAGVAAALREDNSQPLFDEDVQAWLHGPVVPSLYRRFKEHGDGAIPCESIEVELDNFHPSDRFLLESIYENFAQYSGWKLRQMTHDEPPWKNAYVEGKNKVITLDSMSDYFKDILDDNFLKEYHAYAKA